jgi:hypothetical protein
VDDQKLLHDHESMDDLCIISNVSFYPTTSNTSSEWIVLKKCVYIY